jgi:hypothetical protein
MGLRAFSIHAHFYQPPREDPQSGQIPVEVTAAPYLNWNERIHAECYRPNADLGNYERISFNIGPTLFSWMASRHPDTAYHIINQDRANLRRYGVGNAMAQAYNHTILPLNNYQDKLTQVYWGAADFAHHFGRQPQGMWLPETACNTETLEVLARMGIQYTILAPWQAETEVDTTEPYRVELPDGKELTVFFFQRDLSGQISFDPGATVNADRFASGLLQPRFNPAKTASNEPQIVLIASDGELYGHHQVLRDRFLARLVDGATSSLDLQATYPARYMLQHPARQRVRILENTSWSCHHGVGRWTGECPCTPGNPAWKIRLRSALDHLAQAIDGLYLDTLRPLVRNPWNLRRRYIHVILGEMSLNSLLAEQCDKTLTSQQLHRIELCLEAQRERQRMFTSCGWFFEDFDRIEPKNNLAYAFHAVHLMHKASGVDLGPALLENLQGVASPTSGLSAVEVYLRAAH